MSKGGRTIYRFFSFYYIANTRCPISNIIIKLNDDDDEVKSAFPRLRVTCRELPVYVDPWETDPSPGLIRFPWIIFMGYS